MVRTIIEETGDGKIKLVVGNFNAEQLNDILNSPDDRECVEIDILLELNDAEIPRVQKIYENYGQSITKLKWSNWNQYSISSEKVVELLNLLPNVQEIQFSSWNKEFSGEASTGSLNLPNLKSIEISECNNFILSFLATALPENKLESLHVQRVRDSDVKFSELIAKQKSIKELDIAGVDFYTAAPQELKLQKLRAIIYKSDEHHNDQVNFLKSVISSQRETLTRLDLLDDSAYSHSFVDDAMFNEITKLTNLETLIISVDGISQISGIEGLSKLKELHLKTNREKSAEIFKDLSAISNNTVEKLILNTWTFEIPKSTYEAFGKNFKNLKLLKITLGTRHTINFFAKALPNIEELNVKFGEANHPVEFQDIYDKGDIFKQSNLKKINLKLWGNQEIEITDFFEMLRSFDSLENLEITSKFPYTADFFKKLTENLKNVKVVKLWSVDIHNNESFSSETSDALKALAAKLKFVSLSFRNVQNVDFGGNTLAPGEDGEDHSFTFQPLIDQLKGVYQACTTSLSNIRIMNDLVLTAGRLE